MIHQLFDQMLTLEAHHWWFRSRRRIIEALAIKYLPSKRPQILEVGCGVGGNLAMLSKLGDLTAVEYDSYALNLAKSRGNYRLFPGSLPNNMPPEVGTSFDCIVMLDVLEHIDEDADSLKALSRLSNPGGLLLLSVPAYPFLWSSHDEHHQHKRRYLRPRLVELIESNGWHVEYSSYFNSLLFPVALIMRLKDKLFPPDKDNLLDMPPPWLNRILEAIFSLEKSLIGRLSIPFGLSLVVVASRK